MLYLKQSTASQSVLIGPFVDSTDGATAETGLTIANTDIRLSANGGNLAAKNSGGGTHDEAGWYSITLDATDTATVGRLQLHVKVAGALMVHHEYQVLEEAVYDMLYGASALGYIANAPVNVAQISADSTAADNAEAFFDGTGYAGTNNVIPTVTTLTGHTAQTGDSFARLGAPAGASVSADIAAVKSETASILTDTAEIGAAGAGLTEAGGDGDHLTEAGGTGDHLTALALSAAGVDAVWDEAKSGHTTQGTFGEAFNGQVVGTAQTGTLSVTQMSTNLSETTDDHYIGRTIVWITGALAGQATDVTDYDGTGKVLTFTATTEAPSNGDRFVLY